MNDLAEKALHGLDVARREVCARPMSSFAVLGLGLSSVVMVFGARVGAARPARPLTTWFGLEESRDARRSGATMLAALVALVLTWIAVVEAVRRARQPARRVWWVAVAWAAPFALGPPLMDTTAYSYAAFGLLQRDGHSPYASGPNRLGDVPAVSAIVPGARGTPSGSGPLGTLIQDLAVSVGAGSALAAVIILRLIALFVAVAIGRLAADLAGRRRATALSLVVLNPLLLLYVVSAEHLDGLLVMFVLAAALAAGRRRWVAAVAFAALAGCVSGQGFVALRVVVAAQLLGRRGRPVWRLLGEDVLAAGVPIAVVGIAASDGFGWLHTTTAQFTADTPFSVAGATARLLDPIVRGASHDDLVDGARITALIAMVCVLGYLIATVRQRGLERTLGYAFLAVALLAPVLYPWYLLWGTLCLAPGAAGARRVAVLALCAMACLLSPPGFSTATTYVLTGAALVLVAAAAAAALAPRPQGAAGTAGLSGVSNT